MPKTNEKRSMQRFTLHLPVTLSEQSTPAQTRDVSSRGVCFYSDSPMQPGSQIDFTLTLPSEITMTDDIAVQCRGRVVRVDQGPDGKMAVAAQIEHYKFVGDHV